MEDKDGLAFLEETADEVQVEDAPEPEQAAPAPEPEQTGEPEGVPPTPVAEEARAIPVTALLDEREKRQDAQRRADEYNRQLSETRAELQRLQTPKQEAPDWFEDPAKAAQFQNSQIEQQFHSRMLQQSKFLAEREFGTDTVNEAVQFFDQHPQASQQFKEHPSPFHAAVEFYKRQKSLQEIGSDPEAYKQTLREQLRKEVEAEFRENGTISQPSKPKAPPPSAASSPSVGGDTIVQGNAFDSLFPD